MAGSLGMTYVQMMAGYMVELTLSVLSHIEEHIRTLTLGKFPLSLSRRTRMLKV